MPRIYITKAFSFDSAHKLINYDGKCAKLHGHTYKLHVTISRDLDIQYREGDLATDAMVMDFGDLKKIVNREIIEKYDHSYLNDFYDNSTAEIMVVDFFRKIRAVLPSSVTLESVKLWETEDSYAEYMGG